MFRFTGSQPETNDVLTSEHGAASGAKAEKRQITRNRTSYSCVTCRRRKVKCDKARPVCGGCLKANVQCLYSDAPSISAQPTPQADSSPAWKKRKASLEGRDFLGLVASGVETSEPLPPADLTAVEAQLRRLTRMVDALRGSNVNDLRLKDLLTPEHSNSDAGSDGAQPRPSMSLDMFQSNSHGSTRESSDLSTPLSSLKLTNGERNTEDPFWSHISDELDQLNHLMRHRNNTYASSLTPENTQCERLQALAPPSEEEQEQDSDGLWKPADFHHEAGIKVLECLDPTDICSICQRMPFSKSSLLQSVPINCSQQIVRQHLIQGFPTRTQSNVLFRSWLSGVYPIIGLLLPSDMYDKHEEFWNDIELAGGPESYQPNLDFLTVLHAIWYAGSRSISSKGLRQWFPHTSRAKLSVLYHDHTVFHLLLGSFAQNISLYKLAALVLLQSMPIAEEDPLQSNLYMALLVRLSLTMGLHREPTLFELSLTEENMRRRLWWQIIQLDISYAVASGYPSQISEKFCDTRVVCEDRDAYLSDEAAERASFNAKLLNESAPTGAMRGETPRPTSFRTLSLLARGKSIMACALRAVVSMHLETKKLTNDDVQELRRVMSEAEVHVDSIIKSMPCKGLPEMGFTPDVLRGSSQGTPDSDMLMGSPLTSNDIAYYKTSPNNTDSSWPLASFHRQKQAAYTKWARISLSMLTNKIHCVAYAPFLKNTNSKFWTVGRQCALHNCHSFLRKFVSLASDPDLEPFRWGWPVMYGPLHAVLIVLVDLYERPNSIEAPRSRELIDMVLGLAAPGAGIVGGPDGVTVQRPLREGGAEAWDMLRGLRFAAWQKAGLDPTFLWTEQDQVDVGIAIPLTEPQKIAQSLREDSMYDRQPASCGMPWSDNLAPRADSTVEGIRQMFRPARNEPCSESDRERGFNRVTDARSEILQSKDRDPRLNPGRQLARREGQRKMPFPLDTRIQKCSGTAAAAHAPPDRVLQMHTHVPKPESAPRPCPGQCKASFCGIGAGNRTEAASTQQHVTGQPGWGEPPTAGIINENAPLTQSQITDRQTDSAAYGNGYANDNDSHNPNAHGDQSHNDQSFSESEFHPGDTDMNLGFDWERWDAVFGQYSGFTEVMEDVSAWSEYINE